MATDASAAHNGVPALSLGWRLQMSLRHGHVSVDEMAKYLDYSRSQLSRWMNDRGPAPRDALIRQWALRCGVDSDWLLTGVLPPVDPPSPGGGPSLPTSDGWPSLDGPHVTKPFAWGHAA